jgi:hypothetical protein
MNVQEFDNFIGVFRDVYDKDFCRHVISEFDRFQSHGLCIDRQQENPDTSKTKKEDFFVLANGKNLPWENFKGRDTVGVFFDGLQECYERYEKEFVYVGNSGKVRCHHMKIQKTPPKGGYHIWHAEQGSANTSARCLVYSLYLNTLQQENCGETEFLYQEKRVRPVENTMLLWPAAFTHPHRGNPVYGEQAKYIVTGWFHYDEY